jgi:hypothetical protein
MRQLRLLSHLLVFFVTFSIHIRVRADDSLLKGDKSMTQLPNATTILEEPWRCLSGSLSCALQTKADEQYKLELKDATVHMDRSSSIIRQSDHEVRLVSGTIWVESKTEFTVHSEFGDGKILEHGGQLWATRVKGSRDEDRVEMTAIIHEIELYPRGAKDPEVIVPGQQSYLGRVGPDGVSDYGQPVAVSFRDHIERWARLYPHSSKQFQTEVQLFYGVWKQACETSAAVHQALFERKMASIETERSEQEQVRRVAEEHDKKLRDEFRRKFFEEETAK